MRKSAVLLISVLGVFIFLGFMLMQSLVIVQRIASVSDVVGEVSVKARSDSDFTPLGDTRQVLAGSEVRTGPDSAVTLNWVNGSRIRLGPETSVRVRKCSLNTNTKATTSLFDLDMGRIWVRVLSMVGGKSKFEIRTPTATAGVRGTVFFVEVDRTGSTAVAVYEGAVEVATDTGRATVGEGQQATVGPGGSAPAISHQAGDGPRWREHSGIIGPRLDLDTGTQVTVPAGVETVTITGVSEPEATVTINGSPVTLDRNNRFSAEVPVGGANDGMIVVSASDSRGGETVRAIAVAQGG